jgi:hypothetical protein
MSQVSFVGGAPTGAGSSIIADGASSQESSTSLNSFQPIGNSVQLITAGNPVAKSISGESQLAAIGANVMPAAQPLGIAARNPLGTLEIQTGGTVSLEIAEWNAVIDSGGGASTTGLTPGLWYYAALGGLITTGVPAPGESSIENTTSSPIGARLGLAISATDLLLLIGTPPNTIVLPNNGAALGMPVIIDQPASTTVFTPGEANDIGGSRVNAVAAYIDGAGNVVGFTTGMVLELTIAQWDARVGGSTGLSPGDTYWLSTATPGAMVDAPPVASGTFQVMIGQALSTTKLFIQIGQPVGPHA